MRMREPYKIGTDLRAWMRNQGLSEAALAERISKENKDISITQSWLSRILSGKFRRPTATVRHVAAYADIPVFEEEERDAEGAAVIDNAVTTVWNGSLAHANLIARLIRVADGISPTVLPKNRR
jgi:transcriptional regulator with XRE-family HTH domain